MKPFKKTAYLALFMLLGFIVQLIVHAGGEIAYIALFTRNPELWSAGLSWDGLMLVHGVWTLGLIVLGLWLGLRQGKYWWARIYGADGKPHDFSDARSM